MKLSEWIKHFESMDNESNATTKNVLTEDQKAIFKDVIANYKTAKSAVLNSRSGSGKTTLIRALQNYCSQNDISLVVTATTGKASSALGGQTIHSFMGLKMEANDNAEKVEDALKLTIKPKDDALIPDILIIDEASMIGKKLFKAIKDAKFPFVFYVLDSEQLPPVKEKKVIWEDSVNLKYTLTKTLRAKDPAMVKLFDDFKGYKDGSIQNFNLDDYVNDRNIIKIDWNECDFIPRNSICTAVGYRNALVEYLVDKLTQDGHNLYSLNSGIVETRMTVEDEKSLSNGYYKRVFKDVPIFYNGEDVKIDLLHKETKILATMGFVRYKGYSIAMNSKKNGLTVSAHESCKVYPSAKEPIEDKVYINFPPDDVLEHTTLACVNDKHFILLWDNTEDEFNKILSDKFQRLLPRLRTLKVIKNWYKKHDDLAIQGLDFEIQNSLKSMKYNDFMDWFSCHWESVERKKYWGDFLSTNKIVSARKTTARSIHKSQGMSIPAVCVTDWSFYGADLSAQYVALTRGKYGLILVENMPDEWKNKDTDIIEDYEEEF